MVELIRNIGAAGDEENDAARDDYLNRLWKEVQSTDDRVVMDTDRLIGEAAITPRMGADLVGGSATIRHICKDLIKVARRLGGAGPAYDELELEFEELLAP